MSGADFLSEPVILFSVTSISSRWYAIVIFNSWYQIERKLLIRFRSSASNAFWSRSWAHTLFVCQYLFPHVRSHIVFGSGLLYPLCNPDWFLALQDTKLRSRIHAISSRWYINYVPVFLSSMILQPLFRIRSLYVSHVLYTAYLESKGICYPIVWLLVKWALRGVYELTKAFFW